MALKLSNVTTPTTGAAAGTGAVIGWYAFGVPGALIGAVLGTGVGYLYQKKKLVPPSALQSMSSVLHGLLPASTATGAAHPTVTLAQKVATSGPGKAAADALYAYLKANGANSSPQLAQLASAFQAASNSDPNSRTLVGILPQTGSYDNQTSAALSLYTKDPIPPATPPAPSPPPPQAVIMNGAIPGAAATSGFNLYTYLKAHGNDKSAALQHLVLQFQLDVNTDPKFPGPATAIPPAIITAPLPQSGVYDAPTAAALTLMSQDPINP